MKTNLNIIYSNDNIRVFKISNDLYIVEGANRPYKTIKGAIRKADKLDTDIEMRALWDEMRNMIIT